MKRQTHGHRSGQPGVTGPSTLAESGTLTKSGTLTESGPLAG